MSTMAHNNALAATISTYKAHAHTTRDSNAISKFIKRGLWGQYPPRGGGYEIYRT